MRAFPSRWLSVFALTSYSLWMTHALAADGESATGWVTDSGAHPVNSGSSECWRTRHGMPAAATCTDGGGATMKKPIEGAPKAAGHPLKRKPHGANAPLDGVASAPPKASGNPGYLVDSDHSVVRGSQRECWHTGSWSNALATVIGCDGVLGTAVPVPTPAPSPKPVPPGSALPATVPPASSMTSVPDTSTSSPSAGAQTQAEIGAPASQPSESIPPSAAPPPPAEENPPLAPATVAPNPDNSGAEVTAPSAPAPVEPAPVAPAPVAPAPVAPAPVAPAPVAPAPVAPATVAPATVAPAPVAPGPVAPTTVAPGPVEPALPPAAAVAPEPPSAAPSAKAEEPAAVPPATSARASSAANAPAGDAQAPEKPTAGRHPVPKAAKVTLDTDTYFDFDKATLTPDGQRRLDNLAEQMDKLKLEVVVATGHTDWTGSASYNQQLSERRAMAVKRYLTEKGIPGDRIFTTGKGENQPAASNATRTGRAKNRRVEVEIVGARNR